MLNVLIYRGPMDTTMDTKLSPLKPFCAGHSFFDADRQWSNSYFNAEKLFNLAEGLSVGTVIARLGSLES
jgi:hypothetical protein